MTDADLAARDAEEEALRRETQRGPSVGGFLAIVAALAVGYALWWLAAWLR